VVELQFSRNMWRGTPSISKGLRNFARALDERQCYRAESSISQCHDSKLKGCASWAHRVTAIASLLLAQ
jgi:hypothetical protein